MNFARRTSRWCSRRQRGDAAGRAATVRAVASNRLHISVQQSSTVRLHLHCRSVEPWASRRSIVTEECVRGEVTTRCERTQAIAGNAQANQSRTKLIMRPLRGVEHASQHDALSVRCDVRVTDRVDAAPAGGLGRVARGCGCGGRSEWDRGRRAAAATVVPVECDGAHIAAARRSNCARLAATTTTVRPAAAVRTPEEAHPHADTVVSACVCPSPVPSSCWSPIVCILLPSSV